MYVNHTPRSRQDMSSLSPKHAAPIAAVKGISPRSQGRHRSRAESPLSTDAHLYNVAAMYDVVSPFGSPGDSRSSSVASVKSLLRERTEREVAVSLARDRSLDRQLDRHYGLMGHPHMGSRSLERSDNLVRSRSIEQDVAYSNANGIFELQAQVTELSRACSVMRCELDAVRDKLSASMNSIKTFWSPELKKERALRKEESVRLARISDELKIAHEEISILKSIKSAETPTSPTRRNCSNEETTRAVKEASILRKTVEEMELRIATQKATLAARDESVQKLMDMLHSKSGESSKDEASLRQRLAEAELKMHTADGRVLELENELKQAFTSNEKAATEAREIHTDYANALTKAGEVDSLKAIIENKDSKILSLENECKLNKELLQNYQQSSTSQDEILKQEIALFKERISQAETAENLSRTETNKLQKKIAENEKHIDELNANLEATNQTVTDHLNFISNLQTELSTNERNLESVTLQAEELKKRLADREVNKKQADKTLAEAENEIQHLRNELNKNKQQTEEKDGKVRKLLHEIEELKRVLCEREEYGVNANKNLDATRAEMSEMECELEECRNALAVKDRKLSTLMQEVDVLESNVRGKENSLVDYKKRFEAYEQELKEKHNELASAQEQLKQHREKLNSETDKTSQERQQQSMIVDQLKEALTELAQRVDSSQSELTIKERQVTELRAALAKREDEVKSLRGNKDTEMVKLRNQLANRESLLNELQKNSDSQMSNLQAKLTEKDNQISDLQMQLAETEVELDTVKEQLENAQKSYKSATDERNRAHEKVKQAQNETDRLLELLSTVEGAKAEAERQLNELHDQIKSLRKMQHAEKKKSDQANEDVSQFKKAIQERSGRVGELEEALRQSVTITAQRELVVNELEEELRRERKCNDDIRKSNEQLQKRLGSMRDEHADQMRDVFDLKQDALQSAISEKDAHLALLEQRGDCRNGEMVLKLKEQRVQLQQRLKDLTQSQVHMMHNQELTMQLVNSSEESGDSEDDEEEMAGYS